MNTNELLRKIPAMEQVIVELQQDERFADISHDVRVRILRDAIKKVRVELTSSSTEEAERVSGALIHHIVEYAAREKRLLLRARLRKVVNATGVVLHTNLGRAPLSERAMAGVLAVMDGYSTLEYNIEEGGRGDRYSHVSERLEELTGAESTLVVNNNAAAVLLTLAGLARGREVIVSRGELVEIGGSFRIPDVIKQSGAVLVEVGTTNKTHLSDYAAAITSETSAILKVHTSNFEVVGFTSRPSFEQLCSLSRERGLISINDVGSGTLLPFPIAGHREPTVQECISAGFDLVTFSGDKLLGAGQAGIIAGKKLYIERLKKEPLLRAIRIDKLSLASLEGTLIDYLTGRPEELIPGWCMLNMKESELNIKAELFAEQLAPLRDFGWKVKVIPTSSLSGGGSLPSVELKGYGVEIEPEGMSVAKLERSLRGCPTPIIALIRENALVLDLRCLRKGDEGILCSALFNIVGLTVE